MFINFNLKSNSRDEFYIFYRYLFSKSNSEPAEIDISFLRSQEPFYPKKTKFNLSKLYISEFFIFINIINMYQINIIIIINYLYIFKLNKFKYIYIQKKYIYFF
jgi:hypothetical protein